MSYPILKDLKPYEFFKWFGAICEIPHGSENEAHLIEFLKKYADDRYFKYIVDNKGNILMNIPASEGYENQPSILFQAHIDMVCVKKPDSDFDFLKDPIKLKITGDKLHADGTTLGADNGVGVATMLAIGDSNEIKHPELEFLFTVEEETGLVGIRAFDMSLIKSRRMINMDCGDSHVLAVSSMGKYSANISRKFDSERLDEGYSALKIELSGGLGGHSGLMARKGRACAGNNMGELLAALDSIPVHLCSLETTKTPILKGCKSVIAVPTDCIWETQEKLTKCFNGIKTIFEKSDPDIKMDIAPVDTPQMAISCEETKAIADILRLLKTTPYREDGSDNSITITISILRNASLTDGIFKTSFDIRSSNDADMNMLYNFYKRMANCLGFEVEFVDSYCGWREAINSPFRDKFISVHKKLFGENPELERVQGGIETAVITTKIPDMDAVGLAPTARGAHTTEEHIYISQAPDYWRWLVETLAEKE